MPRYSFLSITVAVLLHCTPNPPPLSQSGAGGTSPAMTVTGDTVTYRVAFPARQDRTRFLTAFDGFLREHAFSAAAADAGNFTTLLTVLPSVTDDAPAAPAPAPVSVPATAMPDTVPDTAVPVGGGSLRIYASRSTMEFPLSELVNALPGKYLEITASGQTVTLTITDKILNGAGRHVSALDLVEGWKNLIIEHPAEGLALFRSVDGVPEIIRGEEAVVRGFSVVDEKTIRIKLWRSDDAAARRLLTPRALPAQFRLGVYFVRAQSSEGADSLAPNVSVRAERQPLVDTLVIRRGGDNNPILSFSRGRYDAALLFSSSDLEYARRNLLKSGAWCSLFTRDRYFVACAMKDPQVRSFIRSRMSAGLLGTIVKAEGRAITAVETDTLPASLPSDKMQLPAGAETVGILFRKDDAISKAIAEKLMSDLTRAGLSAALAAADVKTYESALVSGRYGCAVGWVNESILVDASERLRLATVFFADDADEARRIADNREIPLFSIDWYLLARGSVGMYQGKPAGLYNNIRQ
ncbi:MAG: hypothetical protein MUF22_01990 [Chitinispirillaceae bacterium]|jgi:hypothetical protein|nr:hypothetical protein [Chitinispirillaceae bacterium]